MKDKKTIPFIIMIAVVAMLNAVQNGGEAGKAADAGAAGNYSSESGKQDPSSKNNKNKTGKNDNANPAVNVSSEDNAESSDNAGTKGAVTVDDLIKMIPEYDGRLSVEINGNVPAFGSDEITTESFEYYSELDSRGRAHTAYACIGSDLRPTGKREDIREIKPAGWVQHKYPGIVDADPPYLYNRSHLIAHMLTGENANERNLITGTRYFNAEGMQPYELEVNDYIWETDNHVMYRVTPVYQGKNLIADGVLMEAYSVEDNGRGVEFCVFVYNVHPGIIIDYLTGENWKE